MRGTRLWIVIAARGAVRARAGGCRMRQRRRRHSSDTSTRRPAASDVETITEGTLLIGTDAPYPAVRDRHARRRRLQRLRHRRRQRDRREARPDAEFQDTSFDTIFRDVAAGQFDIVDRRLDDHAGPPEDGQLLRSLLRGPAGAARARGLGHRLASRTSPARSSAPRTGPPARPTPTTRPTPPRSAASPRARTRSRPWSPARSTPRSSTSRSPPTRSRSRAGIEIAAEIPTNELYGIAISKENPELLDAVNGALQRDEGGRHDRRACTSSTWRRRAAGLGAQRHDREPELSPSSTAS